MIRHSFFSERTKKFRRAFSLLEILIAVVLIAIVASAAYPAIRQYQAAKMQTAMINDGERIGIAAQAFFAETFTRHVTLQYDPNSGQITAPAAFHMQNGNKISPGYDIPGNEIKIAFDTTHAYTLKHDDAGSFTFNDRGELSHSE